MDIKNVVLTRALGGGGVPPGGNTGQVLTKNSDADYDTIWSDSSGGGGGGTNAEMKLYNRTGWSSHTVAEGDTCEVKIEWSSIEDGTPTGDGVLKVTVNKVIKATMNVRQGMVTLDVSPYLVSGANETRLTVTDVYGQERTVVLTINVVAISISSSFDASVPYTGAITFPYTPVGNLSKTVLFIVDGREIGSVVTTVSGRQLTFTVPQQSHGPHSLECYFTCTINDELVESNHLYYEIICIEPGNTTPIIVSSYNETSAMQYTTLSIPYTVYNPVSLTAATTISVNGTVVASITVDRTQQVFTYRATEVGSLSIVIASGTASKTISLTITESDIHVDPETQSLVLYLNAQGRSNSEAHPEVWEYDNISATLTNFNFASDGWVNDDDGVTVLRVAGDARVYIPYFPFANDFRTSGKTIEIEFATHGVLDYDAQIISCMSGGRGFIFSAQAAELTSEQSAISMQYKEDEHVRISFVVEKRSENRLVYIYVNGVMSGVVQYPTNDDFSQTNPVGITIGSNDCGVDIYCIRVYDNDLGRIQVLNNWIADTMDVDEMVDRYNRNNVYNEYGDIVISQLPADLPYMIIECAELPQYKGDKKTANITYFDPVTPSRSYTASGVQIDVQGTSSQYYARKNYKVKYKNGFVMSNGTTVSTYAIRPGEIATNTFTYKADVASSEGANNVELARLYNDTCPYKTPAQVNNSAIRQGIDGFPMVIFWNNGSETTFLGKYNYNNDKGTKEVFGFVSGDESWEIKNNTSSRVIWKNDDYSGTDWLNDFEARYPDTDPPYTDPEQLQTFATWLKSTDTTAATNTPLPSPVTYGSGDDAVTYTTDSAAYRLAKYRYELENYVELNSAIYYYLFTELFLMVDSRAKNAFPSFMGTVIS